MTSSDTAAHRLPTLGEQAERLVAAGVAAMAGIDPARLRAMAALQTKIDDDADPGRPSPLLVVPGAPIAALAGRTSRAGKAGFVVEDMTDADDFSPVPGLEVPAGPYLVHGLDRGDSLRNASPEEAQATLQRRGRTPLTLTEGISWVLAYPRVLEPNHCFMTIASRRRKPDGGFDARTPALWISGGTGRDGFERRDAPKVGWCWWGNRHTWLGIASAHDRTALAANAGR